MDVRGDWPRDEFALGGTRLIWAAADSRGLHGQSGGVFTATPAQQTLAAVGSWFTSDWGQRPTVGADGSLIVFSNPGLGEIYRLDGKRATLLRGGDQPGDEWSDLLAVGDAKIAVRCAGHRRIELLDAGGKLLRAFRLRVAESTPVALDGTRLVVQTSRSVNVYDVATGRLVHTWPITGTLVDASTGLAVSVSGTAIHLLRLSDGQKRVSSAPGRGPVLAQIEPGGLFYSYTVRDAKQPGRIAFVTRRSLLARFG